MPSRSTNPQDPFVVHGIVYDKPDGRCVPGIEVRAFDKDLRSFQNLRGDDDSPILTNSDGYYRIEYTAARFRRAEKKSADLIVRVYAGDGVRIRAESKLEQNAPAEHCVDLFLCPAAGESEFEQLVSDVSPLLEGVPLDELTDSDLVFLQRETDQPADRLKILVRAAELERETRVAIEAFYGFGRMKLPLTLPDLVRLSRKKLRDALIKTIDKRIIPAALRDRIEAILDQLLKLRVSTGVVVAHRVLGRLLDSRDKSAARFLTVRATDLDDESGALVLADARADERGLFALTYHVARPANGRFPTRKMRLSVFADGQTDPLPVAVQGSDRFEAPVEFKFPSDEAAESVFQVLVPRTEADPSENPPPITEATDRAGVPLPDTLGQFLNKKGIRTLDDILRSGGLGRMPGLPVAADHPAVVALQSHADLQRVSADLEVNQLLIDRGFGRVGAIADAPREEFLHQVASGVGGDLKAATLHVRSLAQTAILDGAIADAAGRRVTGVRGGSADGDLFDEHCCCPDCLTAMGPLAYLTDLVQFALNHIRVNNEPWTIAQMCQYLGQPFDRLEVTCAAVDGRVRQVRLAIEILRGYLARVPLTQARQDQIAAAERAHLAAAYEAVLLRVGTTLEEVRLARAAGADPARREPFAERLGIATNRLDEFFLDGINLTEPKLEELFGLVDTDIARRDPLAPPAAPAKFLNWRIEKLQTIWQQLDFPDDRPRPWFDHAGAARPLIDPDLLHDADFRTPVAGNDAFDLIVTRRALVAADYTAQRAAIAADFAAALTAAFPAGTDFLTLRTELGAPATAAATLKTVREVLRLTPEAFLRLAELSAKAAAAITDADRDEAAEILAWVKKEARFAGWITEENAIPGLWGPEHFWVALTEPTLPRWRASAEARAEWQQAVRQRMRRPIIDPDLLTFGGGAAHFVSQDTTKAFGLFQDRQTAVTDKLNALRALRQAIGADAGKLDLMLQDVLKLAAAGLTDLEVQRRDGKAIGPRLAQLGLSAAALNRLLRVADLAATAQPLLETEWQEVEAILVQAWKLRQFGAWHDAEAARNAILGPDEFRMVTPESSACADEAAPAGANRVLWPPPVPSAQRTPFQRWRGVEEDYREWQDRLQSRIDQRATVAQAMVAAVSAAEGAALPKLRDALIAAAPLPGLPAGESAANFLSRNLMADFAGGGCAVTTRVAHAFASIQVLLSTLRLGKRLELLPKAVLIDVTRYDLAWRWIGSYPTWRAAVLVFLYPEIVAVPGLRQIGHQTPAFRDVVKKSGGTRRVSPEFACQLAKDYAEYLKTVKNMHLDAGCQVTVPIKDGNGCMAVSQGERCVLLLFGVADKAAYWMVYDPGRPEPDAGSPWVRVEPYGSTEVTKVVGAAPFRNDSGQLHVYLFAITSEGGKPGFGYWTLAVDDWASVPGGGGGDFGPWRDLELPFSVPAGGSFTAAVLQTHGVDKTQRVAFGFGNDGFERGMNNRGNGWSPAPTTGLMLADPTAVTGFGISGLHVERYVSDGGSGAFLLYRAEVHPVVRIENQTQVKTERVCVEKPVGTTVTQNPNIPAGQEYEPPTRTVCYERKVPITTQVEVYDPPFESVLCTRFEFVGSPAAIKSVGKPFLFPKEWGQAHVCGGHYFPTEKILYAWTSSPVGAAGVTIDQPTYAFTAVANGVAIRQVATTRTWPIYYVPVSSSATVKDRAKERVAWSTYYNGARHGVMLATTEDNLPVAPLIIKEMKANPVFAAPTDIVRGVDGPTLQARKGLLAQAHADNAWPPSVARYLDEGFFYVPVQLALALQRCGHHVEALDWFRAAYDYTAPTTDRRIHPLLVNEATRTDSYTRGPGWLLDPLNPHAALAMRKDGNTRFIALCITRCLLDFADTEFARDTSESVPRARQLYLLALDLLDDEDVLGPDSGCADLIDPVLERRLFRGLPTRAAVRTVARATRDGAEAATAASLRAAAPKSVASLLQGEAPRREARRVWAVADAQTDRMARTAGVAAGEAFTQAAVLVTGQPAAALARTDQPWLRGKPIDPKMAIRRDVAKFDPLLPSGMALWARAAIDQPLVALNLATGVIRDYVVKVQTQYCVPPNPTAKTLRMRAEANLLKIRTCRNFAGLQRELEPYAAPTGAAGALPTIGPGGQLVLPGMSQARPTPYRYTVLIDRAKQLVELASRFEAAMLDAIRNKENEEYTLLRARQDLKLARAGVRLQDLKVTEAGQGVKLAQLQQSRAQFQVNHFTSLIEEGEIGLEISAQVLLGMSASLQLAASVASFIAAALPSSTGVTGPTFSPQGSASAIAGGLSSIAGATATSASIASTQASYERRAQEWAFQKGLAEQDVSIGAQGVVIAESRVAVVDQERTIANLQADNAESIVNYLSNKFLTAELYEWMAGVMEEVYRYFLQEAAGLAQSAADQLAFERQETPPPYIKSDYWASPMEGLGSGFGPDRRGLTGSARLTQDIYQLDQFAFNTNKRKLQLARPISLARLAPLEFARFRETGVLRFRTPMSLFDRDFPGHYLRLVKRVRTSVVALVPVGEGIRATLSAVGPSGVVVGGPDGFQGLIVRRPPESAAYTSPINATGLFDLDAQPEMLVPFEGMGVDAGWEFRLPPASNPFDFSTIADVIMTVDYTALDSADYRTQVVAAAGRNTALDVAFSFRNQFADAWYDLHNPDLTATPLSVLVDVTRADFSPHLTNLRVEQVALLVLTNERPHPLDAETVGLRFASSATDPEVGGNARPIDGFVTTRGATGTAWMALTGRSPVGRFRVSFADTPGVRDMYAQRLVRDIVLVLTCRATLPEYEV